MGVGVGELDLGQDLVGAPADVGGRELRHLQRAGVVDVDAGGWDQRLGLHGHQLGHRAVVQGQDVVLAGFGVPEVDQLADLVGVLVGQVVGFGAVRVGVEQLPGVVLEVAGADHEAAFGDHLPALAPQPSGAQHLVALDLLGRGGVGLVEAVAHRHPGQRGLLVAEHVVGELDPTALQDGGDDVDRVVVLVAHLTAGADVGRPPRRLRRRPSPATPRPRSPPRRPTPSPSWSAWPACTSRGP